jgi:hypothetical protein
MSATFSGGIATPGRSRPQRKFNARPSNVRLVSAFSPPVIRQVIFKDPLPNQAAANPETSTQTTATNTETTDTGTTSTGTTTSQP